MFDQTKADGKLECRKVVDDDYWPVLDDTQGAARWTELALPLGDIHFQCDERGVQTFNGENMHVLQATKYVEHARIMRGGKVASHFLI